MKVVQYLHTNQEAAPKPLLSEGQQPTAGGNPAHFDFTPDYLDRSITKPTISGGIFNALVPMTEVWLKRGRWRKVEASRER